MFSWTQNAAGAGSTLALDNIPIPLRVYGDWSSVQYGLDSSAVQAELTARLRGQAGSQIADTIGGDAGAIIGGIVGGQGLGDIIGRDPAPEDTQADGEPAPEADGANLEDELERRVLGAIFGAPEEEKETEDAPN